MSKKPPTSYGPRRDGRRPVTIIDAKPVETPPADLSAGKAAPTGSPDPSPAMGATPAEGALGQPVEGGAAPVDSPASEPATPPAAVEAGPLGAPAASGSAPVAEPVPSPAEKRSEEKRSEGERTEARGLGAEPEAIVTTQPEPVSASATPHPGSSSVPLAGHRAGPSAGAGDPVPAAPVPPPARGFGSLLAASALGGLVGAGLMVAYDALRGDGDALQTRLAQVEQRVAERPPLAPLEQRLAQVETAQKAARGDLDGARQAAERAAAAAQQALDRPPPATTPAAEANARAIQELTARMSAAEGAARASGDAAKAAGDAVKGLEGRLAEQDRALQRATEQTTRAAGAMQRAAAAERVADALRSGAPYPQALDVLRRSGADAGRVQAVAPFAAAGAPTAAALAQEFQPVAERIAITSRTPPAARETPGATEGGNWTGGILRLADRIVTVRPTGEAAPEAVKGALDRVETALRGGDLRGALAAYDALPEAAKGASTEFGQRLRNRVAAEEAARALAGDAFAGLDISAR